MLRLPLGAVYGSPAVRRRNPFWRWLSEPALERRRPGHSAARYIIAAPPTQLPKFLRASDPRRSIASFCCVRATNESHRFGLTAQKIFIYGIPDKEFGWLLAPVVSGGCRMGANGGATVRTLAVAAEHRSSRCRGICSGKPRVVNMRARGRSDARKGKIYERDFRLRGC
jgi:hypothetical protein